MSSLRATVLIRQWLPRGRARGLWRFCLVVLSVGAGLGACAELPSATPSLLPGTRTVPAYQALIPSETFLCGAGRFIPSVVGKLQGNPEDPQLVWLVSPSGRRIDVLWPPGFAVTFEPTLLLYDSHGTVIARAGDTIDINTDPARHAGTNTDPYKANDFNGGCYAPMASP
jgi:hypothetical protein